MYVGGWRGRVFDGTWHECWNEQACEEHFVRTVVEGDRGGVFNGTWHGWLRNQACEEHFVCMVVGGGAGPSMACGMGGGVSRLARNTLFVRW